MRRLPRPVRWMWFGILALIGLEVVLVALGLAFGDLWLAAALQLMSITAAPLALAVLIVVVAGARSSPTAPPPSRPAQVQEPEQERAREPEPRRDAPAQPAPDAGPTPEVAAIQRASQAVIAAARTSEGRAAIRQGARLLRAGRAAMRSPSEPAPEAGNRGREDPPS